MSDVRYKKTVREVVALAQDNIILKEITSLMCRFIIDNGIFSALDSSPRQQFYAVLKYFKTEALDRLTQKGYDMGINTPWGKDAARLYESEKYGLSVDEDVTEDEYEDYEEDDIEDEKD